jgi:hypothetical protein
LVLDISPNTISYPVLNYPYFSTVSISNTNFKLYKYPKRDLAVKDTLKEDKYNINIYLRVLDFFKHFIVFGPYICKDFGYYPLGHCIGVILLQAKLEYFMESTVMTKAYIIGAGYIYKIFYINSELYF